MTTATLESASKSPVLGPDDLAEVIHAYSAVAERLQASHEALQSEVIRLREEVARKNEQLERSKRLSALGQMAAGIAHEIRNPLAAIQLYAEMVQQDLQVPAADTAVPAENTGKIVEAVRGLSLIVNDVLSFARQIEPQARPLHVGCSLQRALDENLPALEAATIEIDMRVEAVTLHADPDLLHQALLNLIRNAIDAMSERYGLRRLTLIARGETIVVSDTGPGIEPEMIDRIFNPFFTTRSTGTGLGLAIVHRIVDAHGGTITASNEPRKGGAVFTLQFPAPADAAPYTPLETSE